MAARTITVPITTNATGDATADRNGIHGEVSAVGVLLGTWTSGGVDVTVTDRLTGAPIASFVNVAANVLRSTRIVPTQPDGTALTTATNVKPVATGSIRIVIAQGGNALSGTVFLCLAG